MTTRHFNNFVAIYNGAQKKNKSEFEFPLRYKKLLKFLDCLLRLGVIAGYTHVKGLVIPEKLGKKKSKYYYPIRIFFNRQQKVLGGMNIKPRRGKQYFMKFRDLLRLRKNLCHDLIICSSASVKGYCSADDLLKIHQGGVFVCSISVGRHGGADASPLRATNSGQDELINPAGVPKSISTVHHLKDMSAIKKRETITEAIRRLTRKAN